MKAFLSRMFSPVLCEVSLAIYLKTTVLAVDLRTPKIFASDRPTLYFEISVNFVFDVRVKRDVNYVFKYCTTLV